MLQKYKHHKNNFLSSRILNLFSIFGIAGGFGSIYLNKAIAEKPHFTSWHSKFGVAAIITVLLSAGLGVAAKYSSTFRTWVKPINMKLYHATFALIGEYNLFHFL